MRISISSAADWELVDGTQDIRGWPVESAVGERVGRVVDLLIDTDIEQIDELILEGGARVFPEDVTLGDGVITLRPDARLRPGTSAAGGMSVSRVGERSAASTAPAEPPMGWAPATEVVRLPDVEPEPEPQPEPVAARGRESAIAPEPEPDAGWGREPAIEPEPEPEREFVVGAFAEPEPEPEAALEPQSDREVQQPPEPAYDAEPPAADVAPPGAGAAPLVPDDVAIRPPVVRRESADVEIEKRIVEEEHNVDIPVIRDRVQIRRIVVDRPADGTERPYWQGDEYRIPVVAERIEIRRVLRVVEELIVTRDQVHDVERIRETVRREAVTVRERRDLDTDGPAPTRTPR